MLLTKDEQNQQSINTGQKITSSNRAAYKNVITEKLFNVLHHKETSAQKFIRHQFATEFCIWSKLYDQNFYAHTVGSVFYTVSQKNEDTVYRHCHSAVWTVSIDIQNRHTQVVPKCNIDPPSGTSISTSSSGSFCCCGGLRRMRRRNLCRACWKLSGATGAAYAPSEHQHIYLMLYI